MYNELTFGCDPEVFATYNKDGKDFVISPAMLERFSGLEKLSDQKDRDKNEIEKHPYYLYNDRYSYMMDGVAFELTTYEIFDNPHRMNSLIRESLQELESYLNNFNWEGNPISLYKKPVVNVEPEIYLPHLKDRSIYQGFIFGCDPDRDGILTNYVCETFDIADHLYRYGGGHFHIGSVNPDHVKIMHEFQIPFVQLLAILVGNVSIANSEYPEEEKLRVFHYGKPGRYRPQKWGLEYRTPSNSWIENESTLEQMMENAKLAFYYLNNPKEGRNVISDYLENTIKAITTCDQELASDILKNFGA
jgi:hypothetical protein